MTCTVDGCDNPVKRRELCYAHYMKWWRTGTPTPTYPPRWEDVAGQRFGSLVAESRDARGWWVCRCDCGESRTVALAQLRKYSDTSTCGVKRNHRRPVVGYGMMHQRVREARGPATAHRCVECGDRARHWAYDHADLNERISRESGTDGVAYSLDPRRYQPRCVPCHKRFDLARINGTTGLDRVA